MQIGTYLTLRYGNGTQLAQIIGETAKRWNIRRYFPLRSGYSGLSDADCWNHRGGWISKDDERIRGVAAFPVALAPSWAETLADLDRRIAAGSPWDHKPELDRKAKAIYEGLIAAEVPKVEAVAVEPVASVEPVAPSKPLTVAAVRLVFIPLGLVIRRTEDGEFRVNFKGGYEATAYYTDDLADALGTGRDMAERRRAALAR